MGEDCNNIKNEIKNNLDDENSKTFNSKKELETYILNNNNDKAKVKKKNN